MSPRPEYSLGITGKIAEVFLLVGSIGIERLKKNLVAQLCAVFETIANSAFAIVNGKLVITVSDTLKITLSAQICYIIVGKPSATKLTFFAIPPSIAC